MKRWTQIGRRTTKRVVVVVALTTAAMTAGATAARADVTTNQWDSVAFAGFVPCANGGAGEILFGSIDVHNLITSTVNANGESSQFLFQPRGSMVGSITGDTYRVAGVTRGSSGERLPNSGYTLTFANNFLLIGPGEGNNLRVHELAHVTMNGDDVIVRHDSFTIDCD